MSGLHIIILIDVSYSMSMYINNFVYSLNNFLKHLKSQNNEIYITLAQFNTNLYFICEYKNINLINSFQPSDFNIYGTTALYDAICNTIKKISSKNTHFVKTKLFIISDGDDNASFRYDKEDTDKILNEAINIGIWEIIHCHTDISLLKVPSIIYDINNISDIFNSLKIN